jgi:uncharacterized membrane protein YjjB (DUF3815 family)
MELILLLERGIWFGCAAIGFAILFNVPSRTLSSIYLISALGGLVKVYMMYFTIDIVLATLAGATLIGMLSIPLAHNKHAPPLVFAIPAVIPLIPGVLAYRMMLGLITLAGNVNNDSYTQILSETVNNGLKVMFILMCLAGGVGIPMLITRKESAKQIRLVRRPKV